MTLRNARRDVLLSARKHRSYAWDMEQLGVSRFQCHGWHVADGYRAVARMLKKVVS